MKLKDIIVECINETEYQDIALDKINKLGGFKNLPDIDKLALLGGTNNIEQLKRLNLTKIFRENGGTFGKFEIKVKVKDIGEQPINHKLSKEYAGKEGYLFPANHYADDGSPYVTVRFEGFVYDRDYKGGGTYNDVPIMEDNLYPIGYDKIKSEFSEYDNRVAFDRKEFLDRMGLDQNGGF